MIRCKFSVQVDKPSCFNCCIETEAVLKVAGSHVHCRSGISEMVQDRIIVTTDH